MRAPLPWCAGGYTSTPRPAPVGSVPEQVRGLSETLDYALSACEQAGLVYAQAANDLADARPGGGSFDDACAAGPAELAELLNGDTERWAYCLVAARGVDVAAGRLRQTAAADEQARQKLTLLAEESAARLEAAYRDLRGRAAGMSSGRVEQELAELDAACGPWRQAMATMEWLATGRQATTQGWLPPSCSQLRVAIAGDANLLMARSG